MTKEEKLERLMDLGATPEAISKYLNIDEKHVAWIIEQSKKNEKS